MPDNQQEKELGPSKVSFATFLLKILAAVVGGVIGTLVFIAIFVFASSIFDKITTLSAEDSVSPIFVFILMVITFLASTLGNIISSLLLSFTEKEKYQKRASAIYQIFVVNIIMFLLMVPVYFLGARMGFGVAAYVVGLHIILTAQASALILEIISNYKHALVGVYGVTFSILLSATVFFGIANIIESPNFLLFITLPIVWGSIALVQTIVTNLYGWVARTYDKDFLASTTVYGRDYGKEEETAEEAAPKAQDEEGAEFLRKN